VTDDSEDDRVLAIRAAQQGHKNLLDVRDLFAGLKDELAGDRFWRYQRSISPGLQEYIEALGFAHYLEHGTLVTFDQAQTTLSDANGVLVRTRIIPHACTFSGPIVVNSISHCRYRTTFWASQI
jgi:hypothetical protein